MLRLKTLLIYRQCCIVLMWCCVYVLTSKSESIVVGDEVDGSFLAQLMKCKEDCLPATYLGLSFGALCKSFIILDLVVGRIKWWPLGWNTCASPKRGRWIVEEHVVEPPCVNLLCISYPCFVSLHVWPVDCNFDSTKNFLGSSGEGPKFCVKVGVCSTSVQNRSDVLWG